MVSPDRPRAGGVAFGLIVAAFVLGCGDDGPAGPPLHPASGKVIVDGEPASGVLVRLRPADDPDSLDAPVPFGTTDDEGVYVLGTREAGDGAPVGRYKVTLFWPDRPLGLQPAEDLLGGVYAVADRSTLEATIAEGEQVIPPFEVAKSAARPKKAPARKKSSVDQDGLE
ncbi:hypothetical protein [Paludisphaera sp.]|uniref:hypothetical protein n=1 Tax=Paludisphaera sp. TaxID=2017432 RepID=UPI00301D6B14